jgi:hypothetical protein
LEPVFIVNSVEILCLNQDRGETYDDVLRLSFAIALRRLSDVYPTIRHVLNPSLDRAARVRSSSAL